MLTNFLQIFLTMFAYCFWPFVFVLMIIFLINKYFNHGYTKSIEKQNRILGTNKEYKLPDVPEDTLSFKTPKIETSFGDQRIGQVHSATPKN